MKNNLDYIAGNGGIPKKIEEVIKSQIKKTEKDCETGVILLELNKKEMGNCSKNLLENYITDLGYDIVGSIDRIKGFYEFHVIKKEFALTK